MTAARRDQYFHKTDAGYQVLPEIRKMIVFAPHNLVKDAPFTHLHLISCRNLLIYLRAMAQKKVLTLFHFGLEKGGVLFLGASESPGELDEEFATLNERWKLYRKRRDVRLSTDFRGAFGYQPATHRETLVRGSPSFNVAGNRELLAVYDDLLDKYMPPAILVDERGAVVQMFGGVGRYLRLRDGRLSTGVLDLVDGELKLVLTGSLQRVAKTSKPVTCARVRIQTHTGEDLVRLEVKPIGKQPNALGYLVTFTQLEMPRVDDGEKPDSIDLREASRNQVRDLEQELRYTKESLQAAIEELETSNEELQATNEELVASNEELQSTNEELHSVNEELYTVNAEYQKKITELTELTNDMDNLLVSTEVHTLFLDANLCIRKFTPKMAEVFNLVPHDTGRRIDAFAHNIICDDLPAKIAEVLRGGTRHEERVQDTKAAHFLMRVLPYRVGDETSGVVLTLIEISSLVAAQQGELRQRERFERAIAANRDGIWDWPDVRQDEMWWSPSCYELLGYEPDEFPPRYSQWLRLIHPEDRERVHATSVPAQERCFVEVHRDFEYRMLHKSGEYRWYRHRALVDQDAFGKPSGMTGSVGDIHARKLAEMQNVEEIRRRDNFLAMLSHELRNPMSAVLNAVEHAHDAKERVASSPEGHLEDAEAALAHANARDEAFQIIERQTKHMARLLDDLLDVARFGRGKIEFRNEVVDLCDLADDVLEAVDCEVGPNDQILHATICDGPLCVFADPARIKQAQVNLLVNASKYTPGGGDIWYDIDRERGEAVVTVRDSGEGIPNDLLGSIFDLFVQSENTLARSSGGMGVGLSLARDIVEAHGGSISAQSDGPQRGSTFRIRLPLTDKPPRPKPHAPRHSFRGCKVLLVEDNEDARTMLAKSLQLKGFEVAEAGDGQVALALFRSFKPDVAVIDIGLPVVDGYHVARDVRSMEAMSDTMLIALTGYGRETDRQAATEAGFDAHLVKPLNPAELYSLISSRVAERVAS
jgi:two-component system CheB/CheR fusion protein